MIKNNIRDYATDAFRYWGSVGRPTLWEAEERIRERAERQSDSMGKGAASFVAAQIKSREGILADIKACEDTFSELRRNGKACICDAVLEIYMVCPHKKIGRGEISARVVRFAMTNYYSERQVYRFLDEACRTFAKKRGLRTDENNEL